MTEENTPQEENNEPRVKCKFCDKTFQNTITLMNHVRAYHKEESERIKELAMNPEIKLDDDEEYKEIMQDEREEFREEIKNARLEYALERIKKKIREAKGLVNDGGGLKDMLGFQERIMNKVIENLKENQDKYHELIENMEAPQEQKDFLSSILENPEMIMKLANQFLGGKSDSKRTEWLFMEIVFL